MGNGGLVLYRCESGSVSEWGIGTYNSSNNTLARTTILKNSNNTTAAINWTAGTKNIYQPTLNELLNWITFSNSLGVEALKLAESAAPATPASGFVSVYAKSDGKLYMKDDAGVETDLTDGGTDDQTAAEVPFTPAGTIAATDVQAALEELDADIQGLGGWDHGGLTGLGDDDHTQYSLADGTRAFTGTVGGVDPVANTDLATKQYVDGLAFDDNDVVNLLEDGYRLRWDVTNDSLGTHVFPDVVMENEAEAYGAEITLDLSRDRGDRHTITLEGNPTLLVTNFSLGSAPERPGKLFRIVATQDATGGRTIDFEGSSQSWLFPDGEPALNPAPGATDELEFLVTAISPPAFTFVRAIHRPRRVDATGGANGVSVAPQVHWDLQEASGNSRIDEVSGVVLAEVASPVPTEAGVQGNAVNWANSTDQLSTGFVSELRLVPGTSYTLTAWIKVDGDYNQIYVWMQSQTPTNSHFGIQAIGGSDFKFRASANDNAGLATTINSSDYSYSSTWHFVAVRLDEVNNTLGISVDGGAFSTTAFTDTLENAANWQLFISGDLGSSMDEVTLWNGALSNADVAALYAGGSGQAYPFGSQPELDWTRELNYITLNDGDGDYTIALGDVLPSATIRVAIENDGVTTGTLTISGVDFGDDSSPTLPANGTVTLVELTAISSTKIIGKTMQTGAAP